MAVEQQGVEVPASEPQPETTANEASATNAAAGGQQAEARTFTQQQVEALIHDRLERERKAAETKAQKERESAERKAAEEQGKFKELYESLQSKLAATEQEARELRLNQERRAVADKVGLPAALADRLRGETPDEMEQDAKAVLAALPKPPAPNINNGMGGQPGTPGMDETRRREYAARFGVNPKYFNPSGV